METNASGNLPMKYALYADLTIAKEQFTAAFINTNSGMEVRAEWLNKGGVLSVIDLMDYFDIAMPDFLDWEFAVKSAAIRYGQNNRRITFGIVFTDTKVLEVFSEMTESIRTYRLSFDARIFLPFVDIPVLGKLLETDDGIALTSLSVEYNKMREILLKLGVTVTLGGSRYPLDLELRKLPTQETAELSGDSGDSIKWIELNKSFNIVSFYRLGFSLNGGILSVYIDAAFSMAILQMAFYGLYLSARLPRVNDYSFGLNGLLVSFHKPPLTISGGFYKLPGEELYNGSLSVGFSKLKLTAIGSYGELDYGEASVFIYLMLDYPIGGPPYFFVTGIAAGFGVNRKFILPDLDDVRSFPFVAAALKEQGALSPESTPQKALAEISEWLVPSAGDYFVSIGVAFKSFNLFNSFALLTIAFGNSVQISLLGISSVSMPPDDAGTKIAYAQLNLRAVYDPNEGYLEAAGALTDKSYILDKKCKLTGGFALCVWGKGEYAGDFVITLGGCHHPLFYNTHYPVVDKLGINWKINDEISLKGGGYFAITPSCMMAGANLDLTYSSAGIKAWLYADMAFLLQWKPFFYDIMLSVRLGASYRCFMLFGHVTLKLEVGANLHIWGPEFSGTAHISLYVISFTISFGEHATEPDKLCFDEFSSSFLLKEAVKQPGYKPSVALQSDSNEAQSKSMFDLQITDGILREAKDIMLVDGGRLTITTGCEIPSTDISFNGTETKVYAGKLGAVPMKEHDILSSHIVTVTAGAENGADTLEYEVITRNISSALWYHEQPGPNTGMIQNVPVGIVIKPKCQKLPEGMLPPQGGAYDLETLLEHEPATPKGFSWTREVRPENTADEYEDIYAAVKSTFQRNDKRTSLIKELSGAFRINDYMAVGEIGKHPEAYFLAAPILCTTAAKEPSKNKVRCLFG